MKGIVGNEISLYRMLNSQYKKTIGKSFIDWQKLYFDKFRFPLHHQSLIYFNHIFSLMNLNL